ncbi:cysteine desulfurase family protein [Cyanobium sp. Morenito 9A2]|uniref:cysteine desulfurase family protein n=1 Tax=Cyanobium sp. Morenito 9A2 TaxID=2823718 RepID=UPI0020CF0748|nr:cysteine desulfurase family protein [Cyanobium sp. Morenito 9A2]
MGVYLDACATAPPATTVLEAMARAQDEAWANPSSLHGFGLAAAERLERSRMAIARELGCEPSAITFCSGGTEAAQSAILGVTAPLKPGRLVLSAVEHPAVVAAARRLQRQGWELALLPVDRQGRVDLGALELLLEPPTRLVSVIWGQSEVGTLQPIEAIGRRCRAAGVLFHTDAVQVVGHRPIDLAALPVDLFSFTAHKLQGPRGIGALVASSELPFTPLLDGGGQEGGRRGGTEAVALAAGFAAALTLTGQRLAAHRGDPIQPHRDQLLEQLLARPGIELTGSPTERLPHHISLLVSSERGEPLSGRRLVEALWREGFAVSSGTACSRGQASASPVLLAMGVEPQRAASALRISLGPWLTDQDLIGFTAALGRAQRAVAAA